MTARRPAGVTYRHRDGWRLGDVTLTLHHPRRTVEGNVPAAWLVDLNA